jgi:hypothetical protein
MVCDMLLSYLLVLLNEIVDEFSGWQLQNFVTDRFRVELLTVLSP